MGGDRMMAEPHHGWGHVAPMNPRGERSVQQQAAAEAYAGMGKHQWWYGQLSRQLDKVRRNGTPPAMKHCACPGCRNGFDHIPAVSR